MRDNLPAALEYARLGLRVFPVYSPGAGKPCDCNDRKCGTLDANGNVMGSPAKHPRNPHGLSEATTVEAAVIRWWEIWPHSNIGIATGPESGLVVLDIDPRHGGDVELVRLMNLYNPLPEGPAYETGSGGAHYWFKHPGFKVTSRNSIAPGIDVKGDGGYVIVPPSVHTTGGSYEWYEGCEITLELPAIPAWALDLMKKGDTPVRVLDVPTQGKIVGMERNNALTSLAGTLRNRGLGEETIFKMLMAYNDEVWVNALDAIEVGKIAASAARYEAGTISSTIIINTGAVKQVKKQAYVPQPYTLEELFSMDLPEVRMVIPDLLPEGLALLAGKPKLGKSWMSFNLGLAIASGGMALGRLPCEAGGVLILALEDRPARLRRRFSQILGDEEKPPNLYMETEWPRENEGGLTVLDSWLGLHSECAMVVIDTLAKFRAMGEESGYAQDYQAMEGLQRLAGKHAICIMVITHYRKAQGEDWLENVTGTFGVAGGADTIIGLERPRGFAGQANALLHVTGRDIEEKDYALKWDSITAQWSILGDADEYTMGLETARLIDVLRENITPMKLNEIATRLVKKRAATHNLCARASGNGLIKNYGGGMYGVGDVLGG